MKETVSAKVSWEGSNNVKAESKRSTTEVIWSWSSCPEVATRREDDTWLCA